MLAEADTSQLYAFKDLCFLRIKELALEGGLPELTPDMKRFATGFQIINAIKEYRQLTGAGLKESKDKVEDYIDAPGPLLDRLALKMFFESFTGTYVPNTSTRNFGVIRKYVMTNETYTPEVRQSCKKILHQWQLEGSNHYTSHQYHIKFYDLLVQEAPQALEWIEKDLAIANELF
jgi:hypothetical protein